MALAYVRFLTLFSGMKEKSHGFQLEQSRRTWFYNPNHYLWCTWYESLVHFTEFLCIWSESFSLGGSKVETMRNWFSFCYENSGSIWTITTLIKLPSRFWLELREQFVLSRHTAGLCFQWTLSRNPYGINKWQVQSIQKEEAPLLLWNVWIMRSHGFDNKSHKPEKEKII